MACEGSSRPTRMRGPGAKSERRRLSRLWQPAVPRRCAKASNSCKRSQSVPAGLPAVEGRRPYGVVSVRQLGHGAPARCTLCTGLASGCNHAVHAAEQRSFGPGAQAERTRNVLRTRGGACVWASARIQCSSVSRLTRFRGRLPAPQTAASASVALPYRSASRFHSGADQFISADQFINRLGFCPHPVFIVWASARIQCSSIVSVY